jgi:LacI family transcriptional regulator
MAIKKQAVTILDIAQQAGVSPSTVSRILNGTTAVAPDKQAAVMEVIERLNYKPNIVAQGLVRGTSSTVGVLIEQIGSPFYGEILVGIEQGFQGSAYLPLFSSGSWVLEDELNMLNVLLSRRVDALIIIFGQIPSERLLEVADGTPLIVVGRDIPGMENHCLVVDNFDAAYKATSYLIEMGHTRIAHISGLATHADAQLRREGYCRALVDAGLKVNHDLIIEGDYREHSGVLAVETLFTNRARAPFSAIFTANDQMALGARLALYRRGIRVPDDISLVGFDDLFSVAYVTPPLTTVRQPAREIGYTAAQAVLTLLAGNEPRLPRFSTELIIRESVSVHHAR